MGMPLTDALVFANRTLKNHGLRDEIKILASGKVITAFDIARNIALGADAVFSARGMNVRFGLYTGAAV